MAFRNQLREIGECYSGNRALLRVELRQSGIGAWQVQVVDREENRRIDSSFDNEAAARQATETAYRYGRQFGRWNIQRASDYDPQGTTVTPAGWEPNPVTT
ncbi:hypothetical protein [Catellatospora citrea]|uniref:Uncharacterized protein n=1 Tax=Catellatospora citrea TaxID=53366 RepID=A0A8J3P398_9ACTN|nr:hypothetical protein [Catellatospora citrea]RKE07888.1 hypothetical protein C8E86_2727 [Catellatospora citrea]GIG02102.1 hypothetical protein Cci01nite_71950 [Catellatospora citrea]